MGRDTILKNIEKQFDLLSKLEGGEIKLDSYVKSVRKILNKLKEEFSWAEDDGK